MEQESFRKAFSTNHRQRGCLRTAWKHDLEGIDMANRVKPRISNVGDLLLGTRGLVALDAGKCLLRKIQRTSFKTKQVLAIMR